MKSTKRSTGETSLMAGGKKAKKKIFKTIESFKGGPVEKKPNNEKTERGPVRKSDN